MILKHPSLPITHPAVDVALIGSPVVPLFVRLQPMLADLSYVVSITWGAVLLYSWWKEHK